MRNILTIDVEDYFHVSAFETVVRREDWEQFESRVERNTQRILELLETHETKATFFVLGWVAERYPALIRAIQAGGHEVASHGYSHRRIYTQTPAEFRQETQRSKHLLEDILGDAVWGYRAASYSITAKSLWALDILAEAGFVYDSSIFPVWHDLYGMPAAPRFTHVIQTASGALHEYPLSTIPVGKWNLPVAGGGYLRLFPYWLTRWAMTRLNQKEHQPAIVYLHPWEIDPEQPRLQAPWRSRCRHYTNLGKMTTILTALLRDFRFSTMRALYAHETSPASGPMHKVSILPTSLTLHSTVTLEE
jgi:polysaccharide deacetylase family protein (PEP-CTERM system associated)